MSRSTLCHFALAFASCLFIGLSSTAMADEIVVDGTENPIAVGGFDCAGCSSEVTNALSMLMNRSSGCVTAGELWQFFDRQGIHSVEQLTFCLDLQPQPVQANFGLSKIKLKIEDPQQFGKLLTNVSLGENSLVVPPYEISSFKPEARLQVALGYDFMKRFSAGSQEKVQLDFAADESTSAPLFSVAGDSGVLTPPVNSTMIVGFALFWVAVFVLLNRVTKPTQQATPPASPLVPGTN